MDEWININEGKYIAAQVWLLAADGSGVEMDDTVITIYKDRTGIRRLQGQGFVNSLQVIELLEDHDDLDVLLDLGEDFKYRLVAPTLSGGKIFAPGVKSSMVFVPSRPWIPMSEAQYRSALDSATKISD